MFSRCSNPYFTETTGFTSSIKVSIENFLNMEVFPMGDLYICVPCIRVLTVRKLQKVLIFSNSPKIQTWIP